MDNRPTDDIGLGYFAEYGFDEGEGDKEDDDNERTFEED